MLQLQLLLGNDFGLQQGLLHLHCRMKQAWELAELLMVRTCKRGPWQCFGPCQMDLWQVVPQRCSGVASVVNSSQYAARWDCAWVGSVHSTRSPRATPSGFLLSNTHHADGFQHSSHVNSWKLHKKPPYSKHYLRIYRAKRRPRAKYLSAVNTASLFCLISGPKNGPQPYFID